MLNVSGNNTPSSKSSLIFHIYALFTVAVWGATFVSTKVLLNAGLHAVEIYIYRFILAYILIIPFCYKRLWANNLRDELLLALGGLTSGSIYFIAENTALKYTLVGNVSLLTSISPLLTTLLVGFFYKQERPGKGIYVGSVIALVGVAMVVFNGGLAMKIMPLGDMIAFSAAISWAFYSIILRKLNVVYDAMFITRKTFFYGIVTAIPFLAFEPEICSPAVLLSSNVLLNFLFLGIIASMICYFIWAMAMKHLGTIKTNNYMYLQPVFTLILAYIVLDEKISIIGYTGCALILAGLWLGEKLGKKKTQ